MEGLVYISSAGLGVIFSAKKNLESHGGKIILANLKPQIKKVFDIVKALPREAIFESMQEVDAYLDAMQKRETDNK
jgi:anti-anti-sigma factor